MKNKTNILVILIISLLTLTIGVKAASLIAASQITYNDTTVQETLDELIEIAIQCPDNALCSEVNVGDYVSMTPTETTYTIPGKLTGYIDTTTGEYIDQTINPSELNLWRVIAINLDGTIDMISANVSSTKVTLYGLEGYLNYVGALNTIANQYGNSKYTIRTRNIGYGGQTATITDTSKFTTTAPWTSSTSDNSNEIYGGGDVGMTSYDVNLVKNALGTLKPKDNYNSYFITARQFYYNTNNYVWEPAFAWRVGTAHVHGNFVDVSYTIYSYKDEQLTSSSASNYVRPIVTLKADITTYTGSGTSDDPWVLS